MILRVWDTETCGLEAPDLAPVEVATVDLVLGDDGVWKRGRMWSSLLDPGRPIPVVAMAVHHITDEMVKGKPGLADVAGYILDGDPDYFVAHHARYEHAVLRDSKTALAELLLKKPWLCTYKGGVVAWPDAPSHKNQVLRYWLGLKLGEEPGPPHRALGDAYVTAAIARRLITSNATNLETWTKVSSGPVLLPRLHFGEHAGKPIEEVPTSYFEWIVYKAKGPWDEDVMHTAKTTLAARKETSRSRSPV